MPQLPGPIVSKENSRLWRKQLYAYRIRRDFWHVALMHFFLHDLGVRTKITAPDKRLMRTGLRMCQAGVRSRYLVGGLCGFHYVMRAFGMKTKIKTIDRKIIRRELNKARLARQGENVGWVIHNMRRFGIHIQPSQKDKAIMRQQLRIYRCDDLTASPMLGKGIADMHYLMKRLDMPAMITKTDVQRIRWFQNNWKHIGLEKVRLASAEMNWYLEKLKQESAYQT